LVHQVQEGLLDGFGAGAGAQGVGGDGRVLRPGGVPGEQCAGAHQEEAVAALRLVHHVGGDQQARVPLGGDAVEQLPEVAAQDRVEAGGRFVQDQEFRGAEEGDGQGDAAALSAGQVAREGVGVPGEVHVRDRAGDGVPAAVGGGAARVEDRGEVVQVLADRQVVVHGGRLGDVAYAAAQRGVSGEEAEDVQGAGHLRLGADDGPHQRRLAAPGG